MIFPQQFLSRAIKFTSKSPNAKVSESMGGRRIVESSNTHRLYFTIKTPWLSLEQAYLLAAWRDQFASDMADVFTVKLPLIGEARGGVATNAGTPKVREAAAAGSKIIKVSDFPANVTNIVEPFSPIQFANHTKLYLTGLSMSGDNINATPWSTNATGQTTLHLTKPLLKTLPVNTLIYFQTAKITASPADNSWDFDLNVANSKYVRLDLKCVEHF